MIIIPTEDWYIHYHSNIKEEATADAAAMAGLHKAAEGVGNKTGNLTKDTKQSTDALDGQDRKAKSLTARLARLHHQLKNNVHVQNILKRSTHTAGINFGMLSLRISESLVPVLIMAYTAMLPVIAGLLAIGSAAVIAAGGLVGVLGLGAAVLAGQNRKPMWGAINAFQDKSIWDDLLRPLKDALRAPEIAGTVKMAVEATEVIFKDTLPKAFLAFTGTVNASYIRDIVNIFNNWLPNAMRGLAQLGNELWRLIGGRSLAGISKLFSYISSGLKSTAKWLAEGGFTDLEFFMGTIARFISKLTTLGKSVLPLLSGALDSIYPNPIEPVINLLVDFFDSIKDSGAQDSLNAIAKLGVFLVIIGGFARTLLGLIVLAKSAQKMIKVAYYGTFVAALQYATSKVIRFVHTIVNLWQWAWDSLKRIAHGKKPIGMEEAGVFDPMYGVWSVWTKGERRVEYDGMLGYVGNPTLTDMYMEGLSKGVDLAGGMWDYAIHDVPVLYANIKTDLYMDSEKIGDSLTETQLSTDVSTNATARPRMNAGGAPQ